MVFSVHFLKAYFPLLFSANPTIVIAIATLMTLVMGIHFTHFYMKQTKKFSRPNWNQISPRKSKNPRTLRWPSSRIRPNAAWLSKNSVKGRNLQAAYVDGFTLRDFFAFNQGLNKMGDQALPFKIHPEHFVFAGVHGGQEVRSWLESTVNQLIKKSL